MKAAFYTLGCKVNQYESQYMSEQLQKMGFQIVDEDEEADVYVINSCSVTAESDRKTRQHVRKIKAQHQDSITVLTGCVPQAFPGMCRELTQADIVLGNNSNSLLYEKICEYKEKGERIFATVPHEKGEKFECTEINSFRERTRAYIKIEDGCNRFCSYCIIPYARGRVRSKPLGIIRNEAQKLEKAGFREIVLVGINLSAYCDEGKDIADAVRTVAEVEGIKRVRLGSLEPDHITDDIIEKLSSCSKFCPQFHISLQSGCTATLKRMNRHYTADEYELLCKKLRSTFTDCTLTTDVMVGFNGETDEEFAESLEFVKKIGFEKVHIFPYSVREGTAAAKLSGRIEKAVKEKRVKEMEKAADELRKSYLSSQFGKTVEIIPEEFSSGMTGGYTANYTPVKIKGETNESTVKVLIEGVEGDSCIGTITE